MNVDEDTMNKAKKSDFRDLAKQYAEVAVLPVQQETIAGWRRLNGLQETRPMVRVEQLPWHELDWGESEMILSDGLLGGLERSMRMKLYAWQHFRADMVVLPCIGVPKTVRNGRLGPQALVERKGISQHYEEQLNTIEAVRALETPVIEIDPELDRQNLAQVSELFDGILPVKLVGGLRHSGLWDKITKLVSPERVLYDLIDRPEYVSELIAKFVEMENGVVDQYEALGLFEAAPPDIHCTGAFCDELPSADYDGQKATAKDTWAMSMAQIFSEVSPAMQDEFDITPIKSLLDRYGLVYYGCCEPLHNKIEYIRKLETVRKISISPWADKRIAAENIHGDYVFSAKPNPSYLAMTSFDADLVRKDLEETVSICREHNTPCELILKDISTVCNAPGRLTQWEQLAMEVVKGAV